MEQANWQRVEELFHIVSSLPAEERVAYLDHECAASEGVREDVESLLTASEERADYLEDPVFGMGLQAMAAESKEESLVGKRIGPYQLLALLGQGGMGTVYLAEDTRLARKVALKFLSNKFVNDPWGKRQLQREAQAVAQLEHSHICAVHGFEEEIGYSFIVMQYIEGETLASLICKQVLRSDQILQLAIQIASALAEAHSHGIIHRDIKPQNILVTTSGLAKVLDFGLAKFVQKGQGALEAGDSNHQSSQHGLVIGTVAYMSPEQLRVERLDFRSDLFSFGIVLYEMISGKSPFLRSSKAETITAILTTEPQPLKNLPPGLPVDFAWIIQKCLRQDREQRYQSASELLIDFDKISKDDGERQTQWGLGDKYYSLISRYKKPSRRQPRLYLRPLILVFFLLLLISGSWWTLAWMTMPTIAVLPIDNETIDPNSEALTKDLTRNLTRALSRLPKLRVKAAPAIPVYQDPQSDLQKIGRDLKVDTLFTGRLVQRDRALILQITIVKITDGARMWSEEFRVQQAELDLLQEEISLRIALLLQHPLSEEQKTILRLLAARQHRNPEAFEMYYRGRSYWNKRNSENISKAIEYFTQAVELDPTYAKAYSGLADSYVLLSTVAFGRPLSTQEAMDKARAAAKKALELDNKLPEAHTSMGMYLLKYEWNWEAARKELEQAIALDQGYAPAHYWYSHLLALTGRSDESIKESEMAKVLEPFFPLYDINLGREFYFARQFDKAANHLHKILEKNPNELSALNILGYVYQQKGLEKEAIDVFQKLYSANKLYGAAPLGHAYAKAGRRDEALRILQEIEELSKHSPIPPQEKAIIYVGLGDQDQTFRLLQEACKERFATFPFLLIEPILDEIRSDPRFTELLRCANLPIKALNEK